MRSGSNDQPIIAACVALIVFGIWLRLQHLGFPHALTFDEHHFVLNARSYLAGKPDWNDHPPLGKLIIAVPIWLFGDKPSAWRLAPALFGIGAIGLAGWLASWASERRTAGWIAAALVAGDGFSIAYSRCALLDGMLSCLLLAALVVALRWRSWRGLAAASLLVGSACAVKISGMVALPLLAWVALSNRDLRTSLLSLALAPLSFVAWFSLGLSMTHRPAGLRDVVLTEARVFRHHAALTQWKNPLCSHWYQWFLPTRPIPMRYDAASDGLVRVLNSIGNPLLWWMVDLAVLITAVALAKAAFDWMRARRLPSWKQDLRSLLGTQRGRRAVLLGGWFLPIFPWIVTHRDSYIYHYLPAYAFGVVLVAVLLDRVYCGFRKTGLGLLLAIAVVTAYYAPIWGQLPITPAGVEHRLFVSSWR